MNQALQQLHSRIATILIAAIFDGDDIDDLLDLREHEPFDSSWVAADKALDEYRSRVSLDAESLSLIDQIREHAYKRVYTLIQNPDAAAFVSDDFGMIATAVALDFRHDFIVSLWSDYQAGFFSRGRLIPKPGQIH